MKRLTLLIGLILAVSTSAAFAHCGGCGVGDVPAEATKEDMVMAKLDAMTAMLNLDEAQMEIVLIHLKSTRLCLWTKTVKS